MERLQLKDTKPFLTAKPNESNLNSYSQGSNQSGSQDDFSLDFLDKKWLQKTFTVMLTCQFIQPFIGIFFSIILSKFISPTDLGRWTGSVFFFNFYSIFTDLGLDNGAFEKKNDKKENLNKIAAIFLVRNFLSIIPLISTLIYWAIISRPDTFLIGYALFYWLDKTSTLAKSHLDSNFLQKRVSIFETLSFILGNLSALGVAFAGKFELIVPTQNIADKATMLILSFQKSIFYIKRGFKNMHYVVDLIKRFGVASIGNNISGIFIYGFMPFFLRITLDNHQAGIYAKAFSLATLPILITAIINRVLTPVYSRLAQDKKKCKELFIKSQTLKAIILIPTYLAITQTVSFWFVPLLGQQWTASVPVFQALSIYGIFRCFYDDLGPIVNLTIKKPKMFALNQIIYAFLIILSIPIMFLFDNLVTIALTQSAIMAVVTARMWFKVLRFLR